MECVHRGLLALLLLFGLQAAQTSAARAAEPPTMAAVAVDTPPVVDGVVVGDPVWDAVPAADGFTQTRPYAGAAATERTEVRIAFSGDTLFVSVVCFDREPSGIIVSDSRRDASLSETDSFQVILDTFHDHQNGFVFGTNPAGLEYDGQVVRGGSGVFGGLGGNNRFSGGTAAGFNLNWDGAWHVATKSGDFGWSAELAIPFRTLRYPPGSDQVWGINFQRNIRRRNENAFWAPLEHNQSLDRLTDAGTLTGVVPPPQRNLKLVPYVLGQARRPSTASSDTDTEADAGLDVKYSVTRSLTLDATINTDFAQVEVDEQQVNLDRFNLFFPEKRPFFLENSGQFAIGAGTAASRAAGQIDLFFSRRIGLGDDGELIPIDYGLRLSGRAGRTNVGLLNMQTQATGTAPENSYGVARFSRELPNRSNVGVLFVQREGQGALAEADDRNRTYAVDGQWGIGEYHTINAFVATTDTPGLEGHDHALNVSYSLSSPKWRATARHIEADVNFNPEVGFLSRTAFRNPSLFALRTIRPKNLWGLHELRPHATWAAVYDWDGFRESQYIHLDNHWEWRNGYEVHTGINLTYEALKEPFEIAPGVVVPPGAYEHEEVQLVFMTNQGAPYSFNTRATVGGFYGGDRLSLDSTLRARWGEALSSELSWNYNNVDLPFGDFEVNLGRLRVSYSITTRILAQALIQYNDRSDTISTNLRFGWQRDANTGLFVVYNEIDEFGMRQFYDRADRSVIVKYSYLFDVFR